MIDTPAHRGVSPDHARGGEAGGEAGEFKPWTAAQAAVWRLQHPRVSPWRVVAAQWAAGLVCAGVAWAVWRNAGVAGSALYGAAVVGIPSALLARGMTRGTRNPVAAAAVFMFWEMLKLGVAVTMLVIASRVVANLSWPAMLATMVVCIKVNWLALLWRGRRKDNEA